MRLLSWGKPKTNQLELLDADPEQPCEAGRKKTPQAVRHQAPTRPSKLPAGSEAASAGRPLLVPLDRLIEDPNNPRTEFPETDQDELAEDIRQHGILQPIVVHAADEQGVHCIHFGAKRWRAAQRAGLTEVPVVVRDAPTDPYTQVAENQKRHDLTPHDLARFIKGRVDAGDSNATIAKRLGMDLTSVAHHLALLDLPPVLEAAMHAGRCTSPRTLHELSKLHREEPDRVQALLAGEAEITRSTVAAVRAASSLAAQPERKQRQRPRVNRIADAVAACERLESALDRVATIEPRVAEADLASLKHRLAQLVNRLA